MGAVFLRHSVATSDYYSTSTKDKNVCDRWTDRITTAKTTLALQRRAVKCGKLYTNENICIPLINDIH